MSARRRQTRARRIGTANPLEHNAIVRERNATAHHYDLLMRCQANFRRATVSGDRRAIKRAFGVLLMARYFPERINPRLRHSLLSLARQKQLRAENEVPE